MDNNIILELGGCFVKAYTKQNGLIFKEPSYVACVKMGESYQVRAIGLDAKKISDIDDENNFIFSPFGEGKIKNNEYAILFINYLLKKSNIKKPLFSSLNAIVIVPSSNTMQDRSEISKVLCACGFENVKFIPNAICVSSYIGMSKYSSKVNLVVDIGGSKTDVSLSAFDSILNGATINLGGKGMNKSVLDFVSNKYNIDLPIVLAEKIKEELASLYDNDVSSMKIRAYDNVSDSEIVVIVHAQDVREAILPYFEEISKLIETTLNMCNQEILSQIRNNGIYLCGSVAKTTGLEKFFHDRFLLPINIIENCDDCAILGAGKLLKTYPQIFK